MCVFLPAALFAAFAAFAVLLRAVQQRVVALP
jgi:hypothetical protein